jgi:hypothetical protein
VRVPVPPDANTVNEPVFPPKHGRLMVDIELITGACWFEILTGKTNVQPLESVMVIL